MEEGESNGKNVRSRHSNLEHDSLSKNEYSEHFLCLIATVGLVSDTRKAEYWFFIQFHQSIWCHKYNSFLHAAVAVINYISLNRSMLYRYCTHKSFQIHEIWAAISLYGAVLLHKVSTARCYILKGEPPASSHRLTFNTRTSAVPIDKCFPTLDFF